MHFFFITRGNKEEVDKFIKNAESQYWKFPMKDPKTGQEQIAWFQGGLRPFQLWEYVLPKDSFSEFYSSLEIGEDKDKYGFLDKYTFLMRKALHAEKIPDELKAPVPKRLLYNQNIQFIPIGIKNDLEYTNKFGFISEAL
jgi:hypothetical protein